MTATTPPASRRPGPQIGARQWFRYEAYEAAIDRLAGLGVRRLRTGISRADDQVGR